MINFISTYLVYLIPVSFLFGQFSMNLIITLLSLAFIINFRNSSKFYLSINWIKALIFLNLVIFIYSLSPQVFTYSLSNEGSILYFRYFIFMIAFSFFLNEKKLKIFFIILIIITSFIVFDGLFQWIFGRDIFGFVSESDVRLTGIFKNEYILGSFLSKVAPVIISLYFIFYYPKSINLFLILFFFIIIVILASGDRSAFINFFLLITFIFLFLNISKRYLLYFLACMSIILLSFYKFDDSFKSRVERTIDRLDFKYSIIHTEDHRGIYESSLYLYKENKIFGIGTNNFRNKCEKRNIEICNNHPHNYYIQLLTENGIIGILSLFVLFGLLIKRLIYHLRKYFINRSYDLLSIIILYAGSIIYLMPFHPSSSFYNTWTNVFLYIYFGIILFLENKLNKV